MKYLFDSSVLIAAFVEAHPMHNRGFRWLRKAIFGEIDWVVASHSIAEIYSVLTTLPLSPKISPLTASKLIGENIPTKVTVSLSNGDYRRTVKRISESGLTGGIVYDALIASVAAKSKVDGILTFNTKDFERVWPERREQIIAP